MAYQMQFRELDPRSEAQQIMQQQQQAAQPIVGNPYYRDWMGLDENNLNRQLGIMRQKGQAEAQLAAAETAKGAAWTKGLDAITRNAPAAAKTFQDMALANRAQKEAELTGASNRAAQVKNMERLQQQMDFDTEFVRPERQMGLDVSRSGMGLTQAQTKGVDISNRKGQLELDIMQRKEAFANADAQQAGFEKANPGETVAEYTLRMQAIGDIAAVRQVVATAEKMEYETRTAPDKFALEKQKTLADIAYQRGSLGVAQGQLGVARQQQAMAEQQFKLPIVQQQINDFVAGVSSGAIAVPPQYGGNTQAFLRDGAQGMITKNKLSIESVPAIVSGLNAQKSAASQATAQGIMTAMANPAQKAEIDASVKAQKVLTEGSSVLGMLNVAAEGFKDASNVFRNSPQNEAAAVNVRNQLQRLAQTDPVFAGFAQEFDAINAGAYQMNAQGLGNLTDALTGGPTPYAKLKGLMNRIAQTIEASAAAAPNHALTQPGLESAKTMFVNIKNQLQMESQAGQGGAIPQGQSLYNFMPKRQQQPQQVQPATPTVPQWTGQPVTPADPFKYMEQQRQQGVPGWR